MDVPQRGRFCGAEGCTRETRTSLVTAVGPPTSAPLQKPLPWGELILLAGEYRQREDRADQDPGEGEEVGHYLGILGGWGLTGEGGEEDLV